MEYEDVTALLIKQDEKSPAVWNDVMYRRATADLDGKLVKRLHELHDGVEEAATLLDGYVAYADDDVPDELHKVLAVLNGIL